MISSIEPQLIQSASFGRLQPTFPKVNNPNQYTTAPAGNAEESLYKASSESPETLLPDNQPGLDVVPDYE
jgi:hypothetical protein